MKTSTAAFVAIAFGFASVAGAQPSGGPDAKGNAPLKAAHTINDGAAKPGANSFTEGQARTHILKSGYSAVTGLAKGSDGVWRGVAVKNGGPIHVALDFKGNISEDMSVRAAPPAPAPAPAPAALRAGGASMNATTATTSATTTSTGAAAASAHPHHRHHHHHRGPAGEKMDGQGAAISGVDRNDNGISDKEDQALKH